MDPDLAMMERTAVGYLKHPFIHQCELQRGRLEVSPISITSSSTHLLAVGNLTARAMSNILCSQRNGDPLVMDKTTAGIVHAENLTV